VGVRNGRKKSEMLVLERIIMSERLHLRKRGPKRERWAFSTSPFSPAPSKGSRIDIHRIDWKRPYRMDHPSWVEK